MEYVYDNSLNKALNIWNGLRWKAYVDWFAQINDVKTSKGRNLFNVGFDARHYYPLYRNVIWAVRAAGDFSWGDQKVVYYLGGADGWFSPKFNTGNPPDPDQDYAYETLALNLRGFKQNTANGNNNVVINSEIRAPLFSTLLNRPINNAFLRNFQLVQFFDLGSAWNGAYDKIERPHVIYIDPQNPNVAVKIKAGGLGPLAGSYGFGARSTLLGYFLRLDAAWEMNSFFKGKPMFMVSMGLDF
jgi:outer membrane protein assembly factor BamA